MAGSFSGAVRASDGSWVPVEVGYMFDAAEENRLDLKLRGKIDADGTLNGYDLALTRALADAVTIPVIASGGVGTLDHLVEGIRDGGATAVLAASIFHFGTYSIAEAKAHMAAAGIPMRLGA